jgi:hypothetical protein
MKILNFIIRGKRYEVNEIGQLRRTDMSMEFHDSWKFLGVSKHHMVNHVQIDYINAFANPKSIIGGYVWDLDHGTIRCWGGSYMGRLPRITSAWIE